MKKGYVICRRGSGLSDLLKNITAAWYLAHSTNRDVIIDWYQTVYTNYERRFCLHEKLDIYNYLNCPFSEFFNRLPVIQGVSFYVPSDFSCSEYKQLLKDSELCNACINETLTEKGSRVSDQNQLFFLEKICSKLSFNSTTQQKIDNFKKKHLDNNIVVACVFRYGDGQLRKAYINSYKTLYPNSPVSEDRIIKKMFDQYLFFLNEIKLVHPDLRVMLIVDERGVYDELKSFLSEFICIPQNLRWTKEGHVTHISQGFESFKSKLLPAVLDMFLMKECQYMIYTESGFNLIPRLFMPWPNTIKVS